MADLPGRECSPKRRISPTDLVATVGCGFTAHLGQELNARGFKFLEAEPAPSLLLPERRALFGYGQFSTRCGEVFSSLQLRQLLQRSIRKLDPAEKVWRKNGRYYDLFRPHVEPDGFESEEELLASHKSNLRLVRRMFGKADVLIITLSDIECWRHKVDGAAYPRLPSEAVVTSELESFRLSEADVFSDMRAFVQRLRAMNEGIHLFVGVSAVSPAPKDNDVSARTLASVLHAFADEQDCVDYFPSYELLSAGAGTEALFDAFFNDFCRQTSIEQVETRNAERATVSDSDDLVCEDAVLDFYAPRS